MSETTAVEVVKSDTLMPATFADQSIVEAMKANLSGSIRVFDLPRVKVPAGGGTQWEIETLEGTKGMSELIGIICYQHDARSYYIQSFEESGGGSPPDCSSTDGVIGKGAPGGSCISCALAKFGSAKDGKGNPTKGQACGAAKRLFLLTPHSAMPIMLQTPPTSLKALSKYMVQLIGAGCRYSDVLTRITLKKEKSDTGIVYSECEFSVVMETTPEGARKIRRVTDPAHKKMVKDFGELMAVMSESIPMHDLEKQEA